MIETDEATDELIDLARNSSRLHIRKQSIFWLGQTASNKTLNAIDDAIDVVKLVRYKLLGDNDED